MKIRVTIAVLLILSGLCVILYPYAQAWRYKSKTNEVIEKWEASVEIKAESKEKPIINKNEDAWAEDTKLAFDAEYVLDGMEGIIAIEKIELESPILYGETAYNLNMAICRLINSVEAGEHGNYCLAGHKSRIYGKQFNRLKEVRTGDIVRIKTRNGEFNYEVDRTFAVKATDSWVLDDDFSKKQITLVTCDYDQYPIGRYIVQGKLVEESKP